MNQVTIQALEAKLAEAIETKPASGQSIQKNVDAWQDSAALWWTLKAAFSGAPVAENYAELAGEVDYSAHLMAALGPSMAVSAPTLAPAIILAKLAVAKKNSGPTLVSVMEFTAKQLGWPKFGADALKSALPPALVG